MKILQEPPSSWQDLETVVETILKQCGLDATRGKQITTVRGHANIDVYAKDSVSTPPAEYLVECKYWNTEIPQSVIHSFRTIVSDYGSQHGLIIAKKGFQSGAYEAIKNTNIYLLTWDEFLSLFEQRWLNNRINTIHNLAKPLQIYIDPLDVSDYLNELTKEEFSHYQLLRKNYMAYSVFSHQITFAVMSMSISHKQQIDNIIQSAQRHFTSITFKDYTDFFEHIKAKCIEAIHQFEELFKDTDARHHVQRNI